jgi:hypothetical protein
VGLRSELPITPPPQPSTCHAGSSTTTRADHTRGSATGTHRPRSQPPWAGRLVVALGADKKQSVTMILITQTHSQARREQRLKVADVSPSRAADTRASDYRQMVGLCRNQARLHPQAASLMGSQILTHRRRPCTHVATPSWGDKARSSAMEPKRVEPNFARMAYVLDINHETIRPRPE